MRYPKECRSKHKLSKGGGRRTGGRIISPDAYRPMTDAFRNTPGLADQVAQSANVARRSNETGDAFAERLARTIYLQEEQKRIAKIKEEQRQRKETGRFGDYFDKKMFGGSR